MEFGANIFEEALETLGQSLEERGMQIGVVAIGGGVLLLTKFIERPTHDLDPSEGFRAMMVEALEFFGVTDVEELV